MNYFHKIIYKDINFKTIFKSLIFHITEQNTDFLMADEGPAIVS